MIGMRARFTTAASPEGACLVPQNTSAKQPVIMRSAVAASRPARPARRVWPAASAQITNPEPASEKRTPARKIGGTSAVATFTGHQFRPPIRHIPRK